MKRKLALRLNFASIYGVDKMRKFNYYKWFLKTYDKMPRPVRFCICCVVRRTHGQEWYGTFALRSILKTISSISIDEEYVDIVNKNFWDIV